MHWGVACVTVLFLLLTFYEVRAIPAGSYYSSAGGSSSTCLIDPCPYSSCSPGKFLENCGGVNPGSCQPCTNILAAGFKYSLYGSAAGVCPTEACTNCDPGSYKTLCGSGTDKTSDGSCVTCGPAPAGKYYDANTDATSNCPLKDKKICAPGSQNSGSTNTFEGNCVECTGLNVNHYWLTPDRWDFGCQQASQTRCQPGYYNVGRSNTFPGNCELCPPLTNNDQYYDNNTSPASNCPKQLCSDSDCKIGEYIKNCGTESPFAFPGFCASCTNSPSSNQVYSSKGSWTGNCEVVGCPTSNCQLGQYMSGCGGAPTATSCVDCTNAVLGTSFYVGIGITPTCATQNCKRDCSNGYYTKDCTLLADGACSVCVNPDVDQVNQNL
jgi:hypothetical protein